MRAGMMHTWRVQVWKFLEGPARLRHTLVPCTLCMLHMHTACMKRA